MRILFVDDEGCRTKKIENYVDANFLGFNYEFVSASNVDDAIVLIKEGDTFDIISLDHDMGPGKDDTGYSLVTRLCDDEEALEKMKAATIFIHSFNIGGALNMRWYLQHFGLSAELIQFGVNLMRRIKEIANG